MNWNWYEWDVQSFHLGHYLRLVSEVSWNTPNEFLYTLWRREFWVMRTKESSINLFTSIWSQKFGGCMEIQRDREKEKNSKFPLIWLESLYKINKSKSLTTTSLPVTESKFWSCLWKSLWDSGFIQLAVHFLGSPKAWRGQHCHK